MTDAVHSPTRYTLPALALAAVVLVTTAVGGCRKETADGVSIDTTDRSVDPFMGDPAMTAEVHFRAGQVSEARLLTDGDKLPARERQRLELAALEQYGRAIELDPRHSPSIYRIAVIRTTQKRFEEAVTAWRRYVEVVGQTPASLTNLGLALELAGQPTDAQEAYGRAVATDGTFKPARVNLGLLLAKQGQLMAAQEHLSAVLSPAATEWHIGTALLAAGKTEAADERFRAAAALDPAYSERPILPDASARIE